MNKTQAMKAWQGREFILKDKRKQNVVGRIEFKSVDYIFHDPNAGKCYGIIPPASQFTEEGFYILDFKKNKINYLLKE